MSVLEIHSDSGDEYEQVLCWINRPKWNDSSATLVDPEKSLPLARRILGNRITQLQESMIKRLAY